MLVLARKLGERLLLDNGVIITVVEAAGGRLRLGITAPKHVGVNREEVLKPEEVARIEEMAGWRKSE